MKVEEWTANCAKVPEVFAMTRSSSSKFKLRENRYGQTSRSSFIFDSSTQWTMRTTLKTTQKRRKVTGPTEHYYLNVRQANNTKTKHSLQATECEAEKEFPQNKDVFVSFFLHVQKREGSFFSPSKKYGKEERGRKKNCFGSCQLTIHQVLAEMS